MVDTTWQLTSEKLPILFCKNTKKISHKKKRWEISEILESERCTEKLSQRYVPGTTNNLPMICCWNSDVTQEQSFILLVVMFSFLFIGV